MSRSIPVEYRPFEPWAYRSDAIPGVSPEAMTKEAWHFIWGGPGERLDQARRDIQPGLLARGFSIPPLIRDSGAAKQGDYAEPYGARVQLDTIRHVPPAYMSLLSWGKIARNRDHILWIPTVPEFARLLRGESVALPETLGQFKPSDIRIAVPSQEMPSSEGYTMLRGSVGQRIETALLMARSWGEGDKLTFDIPGAGKVGVLEIRQQIGRWTETLNHPADVARPFAELAVSDSGQISLGPTVASRAGLLPIEAWRQVMPELERRHAAWTAAIAAAPQLTSANAPYAGGAVEIGKSLFGIRNDAASAAAVAESLRASLAFLRNISRAAEPARVKQAARNDVSPLAIDPTAPIEEWDGRAFVWFLRQVRATFPGPAEATPMDRAIDNALARADAGQCPSARAMFEEVVRADKGGEATIDSARDAFRDMLRARLQRAVIDTLHTREVPGDRAVLAPFIANPPAEPTPRVVNYHTRSTLEENLTNAATQLVFESRGTEDTKSTIEAAKVALPLSFPTQTEALHAGLVPSYPMPSVGMKPDGSKYKNSSVSALIEGLTGRPMKDWQATAHDRGPQGGHPVRDLALTAFIDSLARGGERRSGMDINELPELTGTEGRKFMLYLSHLTALASCGWAGNAPSPELVAQIAAGDIAPSDMLNAVGKYVGPLHSSWYANEQPVSTGSSAPAEGTQSHGAQHKSEPQIVNLKTSPAAATEAGVLYVGRPGRQNPDARFGNPFTRLPNIPGTIQVRDDQEAVDRCRSWLAGTSDKSFAQEQRAFILGNLDKVRDAKRVACFCHPGPCHATVLVDFAFGRTGPNKPIAVSSTAPQPQPSAEALLDSFRGAASFKLKDLTGEKVSGKSLLLAVDTGNPYVLGRTAVVYPSTAHARAEVQSWIRKAGPFLALVEPAKDPLKPDTATALAGGAANEPLVAQISDRLRECVGALVAHRKVHPSEKTLSAVLPLETLFEAHTALGLVSMSQDAGEQVRPETIVPLCNALATLPGDTKADFPPELENGSFAKLVALVPTWRGPEDVSTSLKDLYRVTLSPEAEASLGKAFAERQIHQHREELVVHVHRALNRIEGLVTGINREYPLAQHTVEPLRRMTPERIAIVRAQFAADEVGTSFEAALKGASAIAAAGRDLGDEETPQSILRSVSLEKIAARAIANLTSRPELAVPLVVSSSPGSIVPVGGYGGAYLSFLSALGVAPKGTRIEFDRTGALQERAINRWATSASIEIGPNGIKGADDREQLQAMPQVRHLPESAPRVCHVQSPRDFARWRSRFDAAPDQEAPEHTTPADPANLSR